MDLEESFDRSQINKSDSKNNTSNEKHDTSIENMVSNISTIIFHRACCNKR